MFRNLSPWEGRLALLFALALATAFTAGCEDPISGNDDDAVQDDDDDDASWSPVTLRVKAPYGWVAGEIAIKTPGSSNFSLICGENTDECSVELDEPGHYEISMANWTWACVLKSLDLDEDDAGKTFVLDGVWEGEGICSLTPDGEYGTFNVSSGAGVIGIGTWDPAVATRDTFFVDTRTEDGGMLLEGEIAEDLSWIYYHRITAGGNESEATLPLMDE